MNEQFDSMLSIDDLTNFEKDGCLTIASVYKTEEIERIVELMSSLQVEQTFGVRQFLKKYEVLIPIVFNENLKSIIRSISKKAVVIRSLYFDKPPNANWMVNWHQDLTVELKDKKETAGFKNWRVLPKRTTAQPPLNVLEQMFTIRIHLDDCLKTNGALNVVKGTHKEGIIPIKEGLDNWVGNREVCEIQKGGVLIMRPLVLHASKRTENNQNRRIVHIEFSDYELPNNLKWRESLSL